LAMTSHSRNIRDIICPVCGVHNLPSVHTCPRCSARLRSDEKNVDRPRLAELRIVFLGLKVPAIQLLLITMGIALVLICLFYLRPESMPEKGRITIGPLGAGAADHTPLEATPEPPSGDPGVANTDSSSATRPGTGSPEVAEPALAAASANEPPRSQVITYTVQPGDTIFASARKFGLTSHTIYWANLETLENNPYRLRIGTLLNILPVDGVRHIVSADETREQLAERYGVEPEALDNAWNELDAGQALTVGMALIIPGDQGESNPWRLQNTSMGGNIAAYNAVTAGFYWSQVSGPAGRGRFEWPTERRQISGWYFHDRNNPTHSGLDIGLRTGDPVRAADGGVVSYAGGYSAYGNLIVVDHLNGWETWYGHLSRFNVVAGRRVQAGDVIGFGGSTGWSTGPHLHLEMRLHGVPRDPLAYLP
jgi:murein DD-endopeptidase MepM/ murein hydrolase activator NlpD